MRVEPLKKEREWLRRKDQYELKNKRQLTREAQGGRIAMKMRLPLRKPKRREHA
jgi:hypothetical protein